MTKKSSKLITLRRTNNLLAFIVVILSGYIVVFPFLPQISWWVEHSAPLVSSTPVDEPPQQPPNDNTLVIPSLELTEKIYQGQTTATLRQGIWLRPNGSTPDKGSNTVLTGHRFTYSSKAVFYHLDKVKKDDLVYVYWNGQRYDYKVSNISVVPPTQASVEAPSQSDKLTIYTCTPLWTAKERLVIEAEPVKQS